VNAAVGTRLRRLPLTPQRVLEVMLENERKAAAAASGLTRS
jgi:hypothetical protein